MNPAVQQLVEAFELAPDCRDALEQLRRALARQGSLPTLTALLDWWAMVNRHEPTPRRAMAELYGRLAANASPESARAYCLEALDLMPGYADALLTLERHIEPWQRIILRERYEAFLEWAPFHKEAPRVRQKLIDLLVEVGDYDAALAHVRALPSYMQAPAELVDRRDVKRACSVVPPPPGEETGESTTNESSSAAATGNADVTIDETEEVTQILDDVDIELAETAA